MKIIENKEFEGERPLFNSSNLKLKNVKFNFGESPLKESKNLSLENVTFTYKYPLWYSKNIVVKNSILKDLARSGVWYTHNITFENCLIEIEKTLRRSSNINLKKVIFSNAKETLWKCKNIDIEDVKVSGDYFGMNSKNIVANKLVIDGNYCFDGAKNIHIKNAVLNSKDAFWNTKNVVIENSIIIGEYIGWNSKNVTLINCQVESDQGFCYMKNLNLINCKFKNVTLAFEFSIVKGNVLTSIDSIKNPKKIKLHCKKVDELILEDKFVNHKKIKITEEES